MGPNMNSRAEGSLGLRIIIAMLLHGRFRSRVEQFDDLHVVMHRSHKARLPSLPL